MVRIGLDDIYSFNKTHAPTGVDSTIQHLEKHHCRVYGVRPYKSTPVSYTHLDVYKRQAEYVMVEDDTEFDAVSGVFASMLDDEADITY